MAELFTYNSLDVTLMVTGVEVKGFGKDTKIVVNRDGALSQRDGGVDGDLQVSFMNQTHGTMSVTLIYGCDWDTAFDQLSFGQKMFPVGLLHPKSKKMLITTGWVEEQPDVSLGNTAEDRTWTLGLANTDFGFVNNGGTVVQGTSFYTA